MFLFLLTRYGSDITDLIAAEVPAGVHTVRVSTGRSDSAFLLTDVRTSLQVLSCNSSAYLCASYVLDLKCFEMVVPLFGVHCHLSIEGVTIRLMSLEFRFILCSGSALRLHCPRLRLRPGPDSQGKPGRTRSCARYGFVWLYGWPPAAVQRVCGELSATAYRPCTQCIADTQS